MESECLGVLVRVAPLIEYEHCHAARAAHSDVVRRSKGNGTGYGESVTRRTVLMAVAELTGGVEGRGRTYRQRVEWQQHRRVIVQASARVLQGKVG